MANCPMCNLRCVERLNLDAIECPEHGHISGFRYLQLRGMHGVEALIEFQYREAMEEIRRMTMNACRDLFGSEAEYYLRLHHG